MNDELERMWKEAIVAYPTIPHLHFPEQLRKTVWCMMSVMTTGLPTEI
jgi:hypothetical protein